MQAYVINLIRSPDRRAYITAQLSKTQVNYEIVDAVDGRDLDLSDTRVVPSVCCHERGSVSSRCGRLRAEPCGGIP